MKKYVIAGLVLYWAFMIIGTMNAYAQVWDKYKINDRDDVTYNVTNYNDKLVIYYDRDQDYSRIPLDEVITLDPKDRRGYAVYNQVPDIGTKIERAFSNVDKADKVIPPQINKPQGPAIPSYISKKSKADKLVDSFTDFAKKGNIYFDVPLNDNISIQYKSELGVQYTGVKLKWEF